MQRIDYDVDLRLALLWSSCMSQTTPTSFMVINDPTSSPQSLNSAEFIEQLITSSAGKISIEN